MTDETNENDSTMSSTPFSRMTHTEKIEILAQRISSMDHVIEERLNTLITAQKENSDTTNYTAQVAAALSEVHIALRDVRTELKTMTGRIQEMDERQRTIMVGWNAFLKSAEAQLKGLFKGTIPAPLMRKLVQTAFKGLEDMERKGK